MTGRSVLYVSYDGLEEALGQSQVLPYVRGLAERGHRFELLTFEKPGAPLAYRKPIAPGVRWTALRYHKAPTVPATAFDMAQGLATATYLVARARCDLVHVRSYVPCTMATPLTGLGLPLLFDMRGLWVDERAEAGTWNPQGSLYANGKRVERLLLSRATAISTLTMRLKRYLRREYPHREQIRGGIHVIPTCVDLELFSPEVKPDPALSARLGDAKVLLYLGAISAYHRPDQLARFYLSWRKSAPRSKLLVVSRQESAAIAAELRAAGVADELVHVSATREEVPAFIRCATAAVGLKVSGLAGHGCAPTKAGEVLACGVPFASTMLGDMTELLEGSPAGGVLPDGDEAELERAATELFRKSQAEGVAANARSLAERWFSLERGLDAYNAIYAGLSRKDRAPRDSDWPPPIGVG